MRRVLAAAAIAAALAAGCGPSQAQLEDQRNCMSRCAVQLMTCLESSTCVDEIGQTAPCDEECNRAKAECEAACPG